MSNSADQVRQKKLSSSPPSQSALAYMTEDVDGHRLQSQIPKSPRSGPMSAPSGHSGYLPDRPNFPTRASTVGSPHDLDPKKPKTFDLHHARSEDLNHGNSSWGNDLEVLSSVSPRPAFLTASRPTTPGGSNNSAYPSYSDHLDQYRRRPPSVASISSGDSSTNDTGPATTAPSTTHTSASTSISNS